VGPESRHSANVQDIRNIPMYLNPSSANTDMWLKKEMEWDAKLDNPFYHYRKIDRPVRANYVERNPAVVPREAPELGARFQQQTVQKQPVSYNPNPQEVDELPSGLPNE